MKKRLSNEFNSIIFHSKSSPYLYIMDFAQRSNSSRGIEVSETEFCDDGLMTKNESSSLCIENPTMNELHFASLGSNIFPRSVKNSEGCFFCNHQNSFVLIVEIKDCKYKNLTNHSKKAKEQILATVKEFRSRNIINRVQKIYAVISAPRIKTSFNSNLFCDPIQTKEFYKRHGVIIAGTNRVKVINETHVEHILPRKKS